MVARTAQSKLAEFGVLLLRGSIVRRLRIDSDFRKDALRTAAKWRPLLQPRRLGNMTGSQLVAIAEAAGA